MPDAGDDDLFHVVGFLILCECVSGCAEHGGDRRSQRSWSEVHRVPPRRREAREPRRASPFHETLGRYFVSVMTPPLLRTESRSARPGMSIAYECMCGGERA